MTQTVLAWVMTFLMLTSCGTQPSPEQPDTNETDGSIQAEQDTAVAQRQVSPDTPLILKLGP